MIAVRGDLAVVERRLHRFVNSDIAGALVQITKIQFRGATGWIREWRRGRPGESFHVSSNARLGHKADGNRFGREVLELAIDKRLFADASRAVAELDHLDREVLRSPRWALGYAESVWEWSRPDGGTH